MLHTVSTVKLVVRKSNETNKNFIVPVANKQLFESESLLKCVSYANRLRTATIIS